MTVLDVRNAVRRAEFLDRNGINCVRAEDLFYIADAEIAAAAYRMRGEAAYLRDVAMRLKCSNT